VSWWIACTERTLTEHIPAPPSEVRRLYVDLNNIKQVHPLVVAVHATDRLTTSDGYVQIYRVQDRIPLGPFTLRTGYTVRLNVPATGDVTAEARQFPGVRLSSTVTFEHVDAGTGVTERVRIQAPRPLAAITTREALKAHIAMLSGIRRVFEGR
jgi:hypothetical protein